MYVILQVYSHTLIISTVTDKRLASKCVNACIILVSLLVGMVTSSGGGVAIGCGGSPWILSMDSSSQLGEGLHLKAVQLLSLGEHQLLQGNAITLDTTECNR